MECEGLSHLPIVSSQHVPAAIQPIQSFQTLLLLIQIDALTLSPDNALLSLLEQVIISFLSFFLSIF
jgi:hypothetical protein